MNQPIVFGSAGSSFSVNRAGAVLGRWQVWEEEGQPIDIGPNNGIEATIVDPLKFPALFCPLPGVNRAKDSRFYVDGVEVVCKHPIRPEDSLHFAGPWPQVVWDVRESATDHVVLEMFRARHAPQFPWMSEYRAQIVYTARNTTLDVEVEVENLENKLMLVGALTHQMLLQVIAGDTDALLELPASHYYPMGNGCIPTGEVEPIAGSRLDFSALKRWDVGYDDVVGGFQGWCRIVKPKAGLTLEMTDVQGNCPFAQVWKSDEFTVCAVEMQPTIADWSRLHNDGVWSVPCPMLRRKGQKFRIHHRFAVKFTGAS